MKITRTPIIRKEIEEVTITVKKEVEKVVGERVVIQKNVADVLADAISLLIKASAFGIVGISKALYLLTTELVIPMGVLIGNKVVLPIGEAAAKGVYYLAKVGVVGTAYVFKQLGDGVAKKVEERKALPAKVFLLPSGKTLGKIKKVSFTNNSSTVGKKK